jgi:HEAT repeat protein
LVGLLRSDEPNVDKLLRRGKLDPLRHAAHYEEIVVDDEGREWDVGYPVRVQAVQALARFAPARVAADLSAALDDRAPAVRLAAVEAIGALTVQVAGVPERLLECVISRRPENAEVAARALDVLVEWRTDGGASFLVERMLSPDSPELDDQHLDAFARLLEADPRGSAVRDDITERLLEQLRRSTGDRAVAHAEQLLGSLGSSATEKVLTALDNGAGPAVIRAAGRLGDARAVEPVVRSLESTDPATREAAAEAARTLNHTRAVPALLAATQDDEQAVRDAASAALDRMGTAAVIAGLAAVVNTRGLQGAELDGVVEEELGKAGGHQLEEAHEEPAQRPPAPAAPPAGTALPTPVAPHSPGAGGRRRGGLLDRLFGEY